MIDIVKNFIDIFSKIMCTEQLFWIEETSKDIILNIFEYLDEKDIYSIMQTNKKYNEIVKENRLWEEKCKQKIKKQLKIEYGEIYDKNVKEYENKIIEQIKQYYKQEEQWIEVYKRIIYIENNDINSDNEGKGIFYWLGSYDQKNPKDNVRVNTENIYKNPGQIHKDKLQLIRPSSSSLNQGKIENWVNFAKNTLWTENGDDEYFQCDIGSNLRIIPYGYSMRYGSKGSKVIPKDWKLQASTDAITWFDLSVHNNDTSFYNDSTSSDGYYFSKWKILPHSHYYTSFRYFRIKLISNHCSHLDWHKRLVCSSFELYGCLLIDNIFSTKLDLLHNTNILQLIHNISSLKSIDYFITNISITNSNCNSPITFFGENIFHLAVKYNHIHLVHYLINHFNINITLPIDSGENFFDFSSPSLLKFLSKLHISRIESIVSNFCDNNSLF